MVEFSVGRHGQRRAYPLIISSLTSSTPDSTSVKSTFFLQAFLPFLEGCEDWRGGNMVADMVVVFYVSLQNFHLACQSSVHAFRRIDAFGRARPGSREYSRHSLGSYSTPTPPAIPIQILEYRLTLLLLTHILPLLSISSLTMAQAAYSNPLKKFK